MTNKEVARKIITTYLSRLFEEKGMPGVIGNEIYELGHNDELLLKHITAMQEILKQAVKEIKEENKQWFIQTNKKNISFIKNMMMSLVIKKKY